MQLVLGVSAKPSRGQMKTKCKAPGTYKAYPSETAYRTSPPRYGQTVAASTTYKPFSPKTKSRYLTSPPKYSSETTFAPSTTQKTYYMETTQSPYLTNEPTYYGETTAAPSTTSKPYYSGTTPSPYLTKEPKYYGEITAAPSTTYKPYKKPLRFRYLTYPPYDITDGPYTERPKYLLTSAPPAMLYLPRLSYPDKDGYIKEEKAYNKGPKKD